ncbi:MAG: hypothetical protein VB082_06640 [Christensenella sp.]|nr:hypothetical protein [Christensenella sp.]
MISLDFTNLYIHAVEGSASGASVTVNRFGSCSLPGPISSEGQMDEKAVAQSLRDLLESAKLKGDKICAVVSKSNLVSNEYVLPYEKKPSAMRNIIRGELIQSHSMDDHVMDYTVMEVFPRDGGTFCRVQAYLAKRSLVEAISRVISLAGKKPFCYTVTQNCLSRLQNMGAGFAQGDIIVAAIGSARILITLLAQPNIVITRAITVMPGDQARTAFLDGTYPTETVSEAAIQNISKMLQYHSIKYPGKKVDSVYIMGDMVDDAMAKNISASLGNQVSLLAAPAFLNAPSGFPFDQYAYATGALLEK